MTPPKGGSSSRGRAGGARGRSPQSRPLASRGRANPASSNGRVGARRQPSDRRVVREREGLGGDQVEGRQAVAELLAAGRRPVRSLWLAEGQDPSPQLDEIEELARRRRVRIERVSRNRLEAAAATEAPQGVLARARAIESVDLAEVLAVEDPFVLVVAGVTDPRNLGALRRSAECAGVDTVVLARHRTVHLSPTAVKTAAGSIEYLNFCEVGGIPAALATLASGGCHVVGLASEATTSLYDVDLTRGGVALVVGAEDKGLAPLARKRCDVVAAIPQHGTLSSLNVGIAGALACFEVARQRGQQ